MCVCVCVCACVRACVRACVCVCVCVCVKSKHTQFKKNLKPKLQSKCIQPVVVVWWIVPYYHRGFIQWAHSKKNHLHYVVIPYIRTIHMSNKTGVV